MIKVDEKIYRLILKVPRTISNGRIEISAVGESNVGEKIFVTQASSVDSSVEVEAAGEAIRFKNLRGGADAADNLVFDNKLSTDCAEINRLIAGGYFVCKVPLSLVKDKLYRAAPSKIFLATIGTRTFLKTSARLSAFTGGLTTTRRLRFIDVAAALERAESFSRARGCVRRTQAGHARARIGRVVFGVASSV